MTAHKNHVVGPVSCLAILFLAGCSKNTDSGPQGTQPTITNRLDVGPEVVNNLGITFEKAARGRLAEWKKIPGQLEVPETGRWTLRSPAGGRLVSTASRWQRIERGAEVARLASPELQETQRSIALAHANGKRAEQELTAARARLAESEGHLRETRSLEAASRKRLEEIQGQAEAANALLAKELLELRRALAESGRVTLESAILRDDLEAKVAAKEIDLEQARLSLTQELQRLSVLTGLPVPELAKANGDSFAWQGIQAVVVPAPSAGIVVESFATQGENVELGAPILQLFDPSELRFRGQVPEGDLGELVAGRPVRVEFPSRLLPAVETKLSALLPVADATTRMVLIEAAVPNGNAAMTHGQSAVAHVLVRESKNEEVLILVRCVVFDGLEAIVFRRDPSNPNVVIRTPVELGSRAENHVEVLAGVLEGDSVVADGVHQLKQTGLGKPPQGGHFHADGTWHGEHK